MKLKSILFKNVDDKMSKNCVIESIDLIEKNEVAPSDDYKIYLKKNFEESQI